MVGGTEIRRPEVVPYGRFDSCWLLAIFQKSYAIGNLLEAGG